MFEQSLKLLLRLYRSDLMPFKCLSGFCFLGLIASFLHVQLIPTSSKK